MRDQGSQRAKHQWKNVDPMHKLACCVTSKIEAGDFKDAIYTAYKF